MIGIPQQDLDAKFFEHILRDAFDGRERTDRHENRGLDLAVRSGEFAKTGRAACTFNLKVDGHQMWILNGSLLSGFV